MSQNIITTANQQATAWLSYIAYTDPDLDGESQQTTDIEASLSTNVNNQFNGPYTLVWGPATNAGVLVFVVQDKNGDFLVACRGTIGFEFDNILNWLSDVVDDLDSIFTDPWQYQQSANINNGAFVTAGMTDAFQNIIAQEGSDLISGGSSTLQTFLDNHLQQGASSVIVTGHSLGGALANLIAVYLAYTFQTTLPKLQFVPFTFAAPTVSNDIFQSQVFSTYCPLSWQYVNSLDVIPMCWNNLAGVADAYTPSDWETSLLLWDDPALWAIVKLAEGLIDMWSYNFTPVATSTVFTGTLNPDNDWTMEVLAQHSLGGYYFSSLGLCAPPADGAPKLPHAEPGKARLATRAQIGVKSKLSKRLKITVNA